MPSATLRAARRAGPPLLFALTLCLLPACGGRQKVEKVEHGPRVTGKVTYKGEPVPYGVVLFYRHGIGRDAKAGLMAPAASATLSGDGKYEVDNAPVGPVMVCVATDPDA